MEKSNTAPETILFIQADICDANGTFHILSLKKAPDNLFIEY